MTVTCGGRSCLCVYLCVSAIVKTMLSRRAGNSFLNDLPPNFVRKARVIKNKTHTQTRTVYLNMHEEKMTTTLARPASGSFMHPLTSACATRGRFAVLPATTIQRQYCVIKHVNKMNDDWFNIKT